MFRHVEKQWGRIYLLNKIHSNMQNFEHYFLIQKNIFNHRKTKDKTDEILTAQFFMSHWLFLGGIR